MLIYMCLLKSLSVTIFCLPVCMVNNIVYVVTSWSTLAVMLTGDLFASWIFSDLLLFFPGLFAAAHDLKIEWVIVKGISHFADGNNPAENSWESHACIMAASLVSNMLKDPFVFEQWPHYEGRCRAPLLNHVIINPYLCTEGQCFWLSTEVDWKYSLSNLVN